MSLEKDNSYGLHGVKREIWLKEIFNIVIALKERPNTIPDKNTELCRSHGKILES